MMKRVVQANNQVNLMQRLHNPKSGQQRTPRGIVTFWALVTIPVFLIMLCMVLEIGNLWLARIQLKNALESGALAAVKNWGDAGGGDTNNSRQVGYQFVAANTINGTAVDLSSIDALRNYNVGNAPNQNNSCTGVMVFGAITTDTPNFVFDAGETPNCVQGQVLFDATASGSLSSGNFHEWGIRFRPDASLPANLRITRAEIRLQAPQSFSVGSFGFADAVAPDAVVDGSANRAPDLQGLTTATQITNSFLNANRTIRFDFNAFGGDDGFAPGDRFRFGVDVTTGMGQESGDDVAGAQVFVQFSNGTTAVGNLIDTDLRRDCLGVGIFDAANNSLAVTPSASPIPDLPCQANAGMNDGQSSVEVGGASGAGDEFAVRIQATVPVQSICDSIFGFQPGNAGFFSVTARVDAIYDCSSEEPRIYHLDSSRYICP